MAAENGHANIVEALLEKANPPAKVNITSNRGVSALMLAAVKGHTKIVRCLTKNGAEIQIQNNEKVGGS